MARSTMDVAIAWLVSIAFTTFGLSAAIMYVDYQAMRLSGIVLPWRTICLIDATWRSIVFMIWLIRRKKGLTYSVAKDYGVIGEDVQPSAALYVALAVVGVLVTFYTNEVVLLNLNRQEINPVWVIMCMLVAIMLHLVAVSAKHGLKFQYEEDQKNWRATNKHTSKDGSLTFQEFVRSSVLSEPKTDKRTVRRRR